MRREHGFSLIEMLATLALVAILAAIAMPSFRTYWKTQALYGARDEVRGQLRYLQTQVTSESHPLVYGARFPLAGSSKFGLVRYDPTAATGSRCTQVGTATTSQAFSPGGGYVSFPSTDYESNPSTGYGFTVTNETTVCRTELKNADGSAVSVPTPRDATDQYVWFYARGTASAGRIAITHPSLPGKTLILEVVALTGRVASP